MDAADVHVVRQPYQVGMPARLVEDVGALVPGGDVGGLADLDAARRGALLRTTTAPRRQLFAFDNAHDAAQVRPLLPGSVDCGVLVTSRDRLAGLAGAHHVTLHPFDERDSRPLLSATVDGVRLEAEPDATTSPPRST